MRISKTQNSAYNQDKHLHSTEPDSNVKQSAFQTLGIGAVAAVSLVPVHNGDVEKKSSFTVWKQVLRISWEKLLHRTLWSNVLQEAQAGKGKIHKYWPVPESSHSVPESVISLISPWDRDLSQQHKNCFWSLSQGVSDGDYKSTRQQRGWENKSTYQIPKYMQKANTKKVTLKNQQSIHLLLVAQLLQTLCDPHGL